MRIRDVLTGAIPFSTAALLAVLSLPFLPVSAVGQSTRVVPRFTALEAPTAWPKTTWQANTLLVGPPGVSLAEDLPASGILSSSPHRPFPAMRNENPRKRLTPYILAGVALGRIAGYMYRDRIDRTPTDEDWGVGYIVYPTLGAGIGALVGGLIGYVVERR